MVYIFIVILADVNIDILLITMPLLLRDNTVVCFKNTVSGYVLHMFKFLLLLVE